ncbi:MAG: GNAT family N-acetyltransferase [Alphaproteobacteria bacterium]
MSLTIRPLHPDDKDDWRRLWHGYLTFYQTELPDEVYASTFARLLSKDDRDFNALIAEQAGTPIGLVHYLFHRHCWRIEDVTYLQDLFVAPEGRGTGAGRALIEAVYQHADKHGAPSVYWITQENNQTARQLYDRIAELTPFVRYER